MTREETAYLEEPYLGSDIEVNSIAPYNVPFSALQRRALIGCRVVLTLCLTLMAILLAHLKFTRSNKGQLGSNEKISEFKTISSLEGRI